ncbi:VOC family protein [Alkalicaulis satelles]|uniref:VOC family protein n=1 Tax=Alkalicaulis satelles TaxID=2609175 RepID=A0A5M6ZNG0_9PROT|nr:VOC family protein [Alkalicaulis satelles]KAA5805237.1 VOC family protein [Alkalicaulis satelles]
MAGQGRVMGVGGVFVKSADPEATRRWYAQALGLERNEYGEFDFRHTASAEAWRDGARTIFARFNADTTYFDPSPHPVMINLMVDDLDAVMARLASHGVALIGEPEDYPYGRFAWVMDPDGVKIELWQPVHA